MKKAREIAKNMLKNVTKKNGFDEDEKKVDRHLSEDIKESKKSINEDKKLKKSLRKED